jgi:exodeoxyribonuclease VII large subunit
MTSPPVRRIPATAGETSPEQPWPVRLLSAKLTDYIGRAPGVWVEGQVIQLTRRPGQTTCYLTLRDPDVDLSFQVTVQSRVLDALAVPLPDGSRVVIHARAQLWPRRGSLSLVADQLRPVGVGELLAQLEHLRRILASEGLFALDRKRPLPFLPGVIGLICGRASAAERDVVENARRRWPAVQFEIRPVAVQGPRAVNDVIGALDELDRDARVDVIVIARGGGSIEDLLPFSNESLVRAASACRTPLVSAIGHEVDQPLLDLVADLRASTPTDAAKRIVPDVQDEIARVRQSRERAQDALRSRLGRELQMIASLRSRPSMADPSSRLRALADQLTTERERGTRALRARFIHAAQDVEHLRHRVQALSPAATLARGYAVAQTTDGRVLRSPEEAAVGDRLRLRVAGGDLHTQVVP